MKKFSFTLSIAGIAMLIGVGVITTPYLSNVYSKNKVTQSNVTTKAKAQDFKLQDLNGKYVSLSSFKNKKNVYLNFWATWCGPCCRELPDIEKLYKETKNSDLVIITVNVGEDKDTVKNFINQNNYHFSVLLDKDNTVSDNYAIDAIPRSIFIDKKGNIVKSVVGSMSKKEIDACVKLLKIKKK